MAEASPLDVPGSLAFEMLRIAPYLPDVHNHFSRATEELRETLPAPPCAAMFANEDKRQ